MEFQCKYWTSLDVKSFGKMLSKTQLSHKYYFFPAIVNAVIEGKKEIFFSEVAERMISEAWYSVIEHHIHLGSYKDKKPNDWIEQSVCYINDQLQVESDAKSDILIKKIRGLQARGDNHITVCEEMITRYAPYRLLSPFLHADEADFQVEERILSKIFEANMKSELPYIIEKTADDILGKKILFNAEWSKFIKDNGTEILGWINNERLTYLQKRNPQMPGLVFKMRPIKRDRNLETVRTLWKILLNMDGVTVRDIFTGDIIDIDDFQIDHFVPWSYVACDELWNLSPIKSSINLSKSNLLPPKQYIDAFVEQQRMMYKCVLEEKRRKLADANYSSELLSAFEKCEEKHIWAVWANEELFTFDMSNFSDVLKKNLQILYDSAKDQGYDVWVMHNEKC